MFSPGRSEVLQLVASAILAPSADNRHHVRFAIADGRLEMHATAHFLRGEERHRRLLTLLSFGAIGENLRLELSRRGYRYEPRWFPDGTETALLLRIRWDALVAGAEVDPLAAFIASRHTNRRLFRGPPLTGIEVQALNEAVGATGGAKLEWCDSPDRRRKLLRLIRFAETARFRNRRLHAELFESIDFSQGWTAIAAEGLSPATLEVEPFLRAPFALLRHWNLMKVVNRVGAHRLLGLRAGDLPARLAPHLAVLTSTLPAEEAALAVGAAFQRLWLAADRAGLALQPMVASAILATPDSEDRGIGSSACEALRRGWDDLIGDTRPLVVFRLGRARRPSARAGRRPVVDYLA